MKRMTAALLALLMLLSAVACTPTADPPADATEGVTDAPDTTVEDTTEAESEPGTVVDWSSWTPVEGADVTELTVSNTVESTLPELIPVTQAFSKDNGAYTYTQAEVSETKIVFRYHTVNALNLVQPFEHQSATFTMDVTLPDFNELDWNCLYFGLRLDNFQRDGTQGRGVWLAFRYDSIGVLTGTWPQTKYIPIDTSTVDLSKKRSLTIVDDMDNNEITVSAVNDQGETRVLAIYKINGSEVSLYAPGATEPACVETMPNPIPNSGYCRLWGHGLTADTVIEKFSATGYTQTRETAASPNMLNSKDVLADTWVNVDDLNRVSEYVAKAANNKKVGIFYFLWHDGATNQPIYDHTAAWMEGGANKLIETIAAGPLGFSHYWAEPYFGYYQSNDEWVIRKHGMQLAAAGVDFVMFDVSNADTYPTNYEAICKVWSEMRAEGYDTPQISFFLGNNFENCKKKYSELWVNLYSLGRYEDLWFKLDGKPLLRVTREFRSKMMTDEQQEFFTIRYVEREARKSKWSWCNFIVNSNDKGADIGLDEKGNIEQMTAMVGFWANGSYGTNAGRSYTTVTGQPPFSGKYEMDFGFGLTEAGLTGQGLAFQEQLDVIMGIDPEVLFITGWNEWWAGRWTDGATGQTIANTYTVTNDGAWTNNYYVDAFNPEYSRDAEPVKGLFNDNYYYQIVQNVRKFKGSRAPLAAFGQRPITMAGVESQWDIVGPEYRDYVGDTAHRDHMSYVGQIHYTNTTGRNDLDTAKVSRWEDTLYFYVSCASDITSPEGTNWMNLYINADRKQETGWYGFDYVINRDRDGETCSVMKFADGKWEMTEVGRAAYAVNRSYMVIALDAAALGIGETFEFKWADNSVDSGDVMQFLDLGDTAPNDRFNYLYTTTETEPVLPKELTADMIVLKAGSYHAFVGGELVRLDESTTKATFFGDTEHLYLPFAFAKSLGLAKEGDTTYNHYGVQYVDISAALESCGKTLTRIEDMLVLADTAQDEDTMLILYRALY